MLVELAATMSELWGGESASVPTRSSRTPQRAAVRCREVAREHGASDGVLDDALDLRATARQSAVARDQLGLDPL